MQAHVSIILPVHNAEPWLDECLRSVLQQDFEGTMELSVFNDASKDKSGAIIEKWRVKLEDSGVHVIIGGHDSLSPRGVGYSKNQAVAQSSGSYLCFLDSDDVMMPQRVRLQHQAAVQHPSSIVGCRVRRDPPNSTERYTRWINQLTPEQLLTQVFTANGPTVIMPTWFCSRAWFSHVGPFDEGGQGVPEDLLFFYEHLRKGGGVVRVDQSLLLYRYHPRAATHSVLETTIWTHRVRFLEEQALPRWAAFTIWNAGKQGRRLYRSLTAASQRKVVAFCDVDENKIRKGFYCHEDSQERPKPRIPILHFRAARPPFVICVKLVDTGHPQPLALEEAPQWPPGARRGGTELYLLLPPGPHRGRLRGQPEVVALAGGPGLPSLQLTDPRQPLPEATCSLHPQCIPGQQELRELQA
uniref:UDP-GlcNAc:betaGal beta-1,3-N-acetylglucosaminyltransferase-like protein 1 isoform X1 n=1 Tax=Macaca mulatta TaxID=9544 RepID=UPI0010A24593|nr:UDP-GlcNAc:betaGal beta-1,3-N-acetylglucosaminyltransferase-like protein 1 isoform X1 [Macaca mulatta]